MNFRTETPMRLSQVAEYLGVYRSSPLHFVRPWLVAPNYGLKQ
jgi:hypothetical protein